MASASNGRAEVTPEPRVFPRLRIPAFLMPDDHDGPIPVTVPASLERRKSADNCRIISEKTISVHFDEPVGESLYMVQRIGSLGVTRDLDTLPPGQIPVDRRSQLFNTLLESRYRRGQVCTGFLVLKGPHLFELLLEFVERFLEFQ